MARMCARRGCDSTELIYSGVDAMLRGVPTETICYSCAGTYALVKEALNEIWKYSEAE